MIRVLHAEWTKLRTARATVWTPVLGFAAVPGLAVLVALTDSLRDDDTVLGASLTGAAVGQLAAAALGVLAVSTEYATGMVRTTFAACPRRLAVFAAKAVVVTGVTLVGGLAASGAAYAVGGWATLGVVAAWTAAALLLAALLLTRRDA